MTKFGLIRSQVARQLNNYKKDKYQHSSLSFVMGSSSDIEQMLRDGLSMGTSDFVAQTLYRICNPKPEYGTDFNNLVKAMDNYPPEVRAYLSLLAGSPENSCFGHLVGHVEHWTTAMTETLPSSAAGLPHAEIEFVKRRESHMDTFLVSFMNEHASTGLVDALKRERFGDLGRLVHVILFLTWWTTVCDKEKPAIKVPVECLVGKYA